MAKDELGDIEWLAQCTSRERAAIRRHADYVEVPAGTVLLHEGDVPRWFYAVVAGDAKLTAEGDAVGRVTAGQPINDVEVLRNEPATTTVTADSDLRVLVMGRREFLGMLDDVPGLARRLLERRIPQTRSAARRRPTLVPVPAA